jgi:ornithine cyclodeaminase
MPTIEKPRSPRFAVIPGNVISDIVSSRHKEIIDLVDKTYRQFALGQAINPSSHFLRFADNPQNRIIALPAAILDGVGIAGIKWISSFPDNINYGIPRASAVLILNDLKTGFPFACLEGSIISAARTAASAVLGAYWLRNRNRSVASLGVIGAGTIAKRIVEYLFWSGWQIQTINSFDLQSEQAELLNSYAQQQGDVKTRVCDSYQEVVLQSELIVFATTSSAPYINDASLFRHNPCILHISLRDLGIEIIQKANNIVDDLEHCLQANTSVHLAEQAYGDRRFITGDIVQLMNAQCRLKPGHPSIFSPFGMGILDVALGNHVYDIAAWNNQVLVIDNFTTMDRWQ